MNWSRRDFIGSMGMTGASFALAGCKCPFRSPQPKVAVQLYSIREYIVGCKDKNTGAFLQPGVGLERALKEVSAIGYEGVEFAGYYGHDAKTIRAMLDDSGLVACGTHIGRDVIGPDKLAKACEFNLGFGNDLLICPGGGNFPKEGECLDDFLKMLVDYYNKAAEDAARYGCKVGIHNHTREFELKLKNGQIYWDYFFSNTDPRVCMEQDVGWTTCAGHDPKSQYVKYPHRSPTLHAKENGMGTGVSEFDAILGQPGRPGATPVDWDGLITVARNDGVKWFVVECERHGNDFSAIKPSREFLAAKGL